MADPAKPSRLAALVQGFMSRDGTPVSDDEYKAMEAEYGGIPGLQYATQTARGEHPGEKSALQGVPPSILAQLDRYTHGATAAQYNPFGIADPTNVGYGALSAGVFGASELGKALGLGKPMSAVTRAVAGPDSKIDFFDETGDTSPPSVNNVTSIVKGFGRGGSLAQRLIDGFRGQQGQK